ncbi:MAG: SusC/RagA family TonB-linked outer membrane protein [Bacteroidales bacterium]|nr:SusC/RagA family TonB-linked outer membrane protein [Bacteroidales bacterium]
MTKKYSYSTCLTLITLFITSMFIHPLLAQTSGVNITGVVTESGTGLPLSQVSVSVSTTGASSETDEQGAFTIAVPDLETELIINLPGYNKRNIHLNGRDFVTVYMVSSLYRSLDNSFNSPVGPEIIKDATFPVTTVTASDLKLSQATSFDQALQGRVPGMSVVEQSGMPGHRTFMSLRGISSLYANTEPLLFIDGMIYDYSYAKNSLMEGFALNPFDIVDIDDISDISILKSGVSYLGAAGSNGVININTEQKAEASTVIKFSAYGGISMVPKKQDLLNASQFKNYFSERLISQGFDEDQINAMVPWLNGDASSEDYYKYNNSTDWQDEIFRPAAVSKYHFFLKGGDDIATYNISVGYLSHKGIYENAGYTRFNLRINGKVNISDKFSITPNAKLSLADSKLANQGPSAWKNPILSAVLMPPIMAPNARDASTGEFLNYIDDVGIFNASNPTAIVNSASGTNRNYHFLSSVTAQYKFNEHFNLSTLIGINFNNARENIFLPDRGILQVDSAFNSPGDFVYEFRSTQNHTALTYTNKTASGHTIAMNAGFRYMRNSYKYDLSTDLNTPSDDFKSLGRGAQYSFLRSTIGDNRGLVWVSYFGNINYNFRNKYFVSTNLSYDGNSATNAENRYNLYPSVGAAWRLSSESFLNQVSWLEDLKLRGSYSVTGNMFTSVYDYSKLYYTSRRINGNGVITREIIPNENMGLEKKHTVNAGLDLSILRQLVNMHLDIYRSNVNNLIIQQELPPTLGFTTYYDNGGKLEISGLEIAADGRLKAGDFVVTVGGSVSKELTKIKSLAFINPATENIITTIPGAQFITSAGNPVNAYYGYKTDGLISNAEAGTVTGPKGILMQAGDMKFVDIDANNIIDKNDKMIIGDPNPDIFGSIYTAFSYKHFELLAYFNYSIGNDVFNYIKYKSEAMDSYCNQSASVLERWTTSNTSAAMPGASFGDPAGNAVFSDRWIEDGSYLRLGQLTLNYNLQSRPGIYKGVVIYLTATNLFTLTKYSGYDPDFMYLNSPFYMGVDYGMMPQTRSFIIGLKLDL